MRSRLKFIVEARYAPRFALPYPHKHTHTHTLPSDSIGWEEANATLKAEMPSGLVV